MSEARQEEAALVLRIRELEGRLREAEETLEAIRRGGVDALVVSHAEGDERIYTLESADAPYRALIERIQEGAISVRVDGTLFYSNARLAEMRGVPQDRLMGQNLKSFVLRDDVATLSKMLQEAIRTSARSEITLVAYDGRQIPIYLSLSLLRYEEDMPLLCGVITDLTGQKHHLRELSAANARLQEEIAGRTEVELALRHAQKMEAIGTLAAGVAHDFNNILQAVIGGLELTREAMEDGAHGQKFADIALQAARRGAYLTHHLLSYARKQVLLPKVVDLVPFLTDLRTLLGRTLGPHVSIELYVEGSVSVVVDPGQLQTALLNLAINASHAMPKGGTLSIDVRESPEDGRLMVITVADTGSGMDAATLARAVEPFFTTKGLDGTGLGLSMVQGFVEQSGGRFRIDSAVGVGTNVELCLPSGDPGPDHKRPDAAAYEPRRRGRILLVDDAIDVLVTMAATLQNAGFDVVQAESGDRAIALLAGNDRFDALVTDYAMPGLNGADLISEGRIVQPGLPTLIITGFAGINYAEALPEKVLVLQKPFQGTALIDALACIMETTHPSAMPMGTDPVRGPIRMTQ